MIPSSAEARPGPTPRTTRDLRIAAGALIGVGLVWPLLPAEPPLVCPLRALTGIPCPFCGMTRSVVAALHLDLPASLSFNPAGIVFIALVVAVLVKPALLTRIRPPVWAVVAVMAVMWLWNIGFNPTFNQLFLPS